MYKYSKEIYEIIEKAVNENNKKLNYEDITSQLTLNI